MEQENNKKTGGRPVAEDKKSMVPVYYTQSEKKYLHARAEANGYRHMSKFLHTLSLKNVERLRPISPNAVQLVGNLRQIGANINQISRAMNRANLGYISIDKTQMEEYKTRLDEYIITIKAILGHLENE
jgi:hypothetical protein